MGVGNLAGEFLVIHLVIVPADALFGHAGGAAGFKNGEGAALEFFWHPDFGLQIAQPFVLEMGKTLEIVEALDGGGGIPAGLLCPIEPEGAAGVGRKVPLDDVTNVGVERFAGRGRGI